MSTFTLNLLINCQNILRISFQLKKYFRLSAPKAKAAQYFKNIKTTLLLLLTIYFFCIVCYPSCFWIVDRTHSTKRTRMEQSQTKLSPQFSSMDKYLIYHIFLFTSQTARSQLNGIIITPEIQSLQPSLSPKNICYSVIQYIK